MPRRLTRAAVLAAGTLVVLASAAAAHVDIDPTEAVAGSTVTLRFSFHHGLDGTATVGLEVQVPEGATVVDVPEVDGWTSAFDADERVVTWSGEPVPDGVEASFPLVVRLPPEPGVVLFPAIQISETGGELAWISEEEGEGEDANPAPRITLVADPDPPATTEPTTTTTEPTTTDPGPTTTNDLPGTSLEAEQRDEGDDPLGPLVVGSGVAALVAVVVGGTLLKRRTG